MGGRESDSTAAPARASRSMRTDDPGRVGRRGSARNGSVAAARGKSTFRTLDGVSRRDTTITAARSRPAPRHAVDHREARETAGSGKSSARAIRRAKAGRAGRR
jgi:hypothetical protein